MNLQAGAILTFELRVRSSPDALNTHVRYPGDSRQDGGLMSAIVDALLSELTNADLDVLAERLAPRLARLAVAEQKGDGGYLSADKAAEYLATSRERVYDLVQLRKLEPRRDGRRLLFRRGDLDAYLEACR
jgi:excisionase family DNA binding protein